VQNEPVQETRDGFDPILVGEYGDENIFPCVCLDASLCLTGRFWEKQV
jgi:hypothetical protein